MRLTVFNGSPRGKASNTAILLEHFLAGFEEQPGGGHETFYLIREKDPAVPVEAFREAQTVLLAFPLYTDCMPAVVKVFIESLEPLCGRNGNPALGFLVHSGFPESVHSQNLRRYLEKLSRRLGCRCLGTVTRGNSEGVRAQPAIINRRVFSLMFELGRVFGETGRFDKQLMEKLAGPVRFSWLGLLGARLGLKMGQLFYWDKELKKHGAYDKRFARPYEPEKNNRGTDNDSKPERRASR